MSVHTASPLGTPVVAGAEPPEPAADPGEHGENPCPGGYHTPLQTGWLKATEAYVLRELWLDIQDAVSAGTRCRECAGAVPCPASLQLPLASTAWCALAGGHKTPSPTGVLCQWPDLPLLVRTRHWVRAYP